MASQRDDYRYCGYDMGYFKWTVASEVVGLTRKEARAIGWTLKRNGRMRQYFDASGTLMEAYSYNTCVMCRMKPDADFPLGRIIINKTAYSVTSRKHLDVVKANFKKFQYLPAQQIEGQYARGIGMSYSIVSTDYMFHADCINLHSEIDSDDLRAVISRMQAQAETILE